MKKKMPKLGEEISDQQTAVIQDLREELNEATVIIQKYKAAVDHLIGSQYHSQISETERTSSIGLKSEDRTNPILEAIKNL